MLRPRTLAAHSGRTTCGEVSLIARICVARAEGAPNAMNVPSGRSISAIQIDDLGVMSVTRREARLLEVSLTPTPAYAGAKVALVRSRRAQVDGTPRRSAEIEAWRHYLDSLTRR